MGQDARGAVRGGGLLNGGLQAGSVGDVALNGHAADVGGDLLRIGQVDVEHGDLGAQAGEFAGGGLAEARSAAGDEGGLSLNVHLETPVNY